MLEWIDAAASGELPILRSRGEGQQVEFMREFPSNARELAKEIAAFASTNAGTILIGVSDEGDLVGIPDAAQAQARDSLVRRIEGLCNGSIQPSITPSAVFAEEAGMIVMVLKIPRGSQPVYYCQHVPYVRHLTEARPARPDEVIERVEAWLSLKPGDTDPRSEFYGTLISGVRELLLWTDELSERRVNPWLDSLKWLLESHGSDLRRLAATDAAIDLGLRGPIEALADKTDAAANHKLYLGGESWNEFKRLVADVESSASTIKREIIDALEVDDRVRQHAVDELKRASRELESLERRADHLLETGRLQELQNAAATIGRTIKRLSYWGLDREPIDFVRKLRQVGRDLHVLETLRMTVGGAEPQRLRDAVRTESTELEQLAEKISTA